MEQSYLKHAIRHLQISEHMFYVTYSLVEEEKLLLKILDELYKSIDNSLSILIPDYQKISSKDKIILLKSAKINILNENQKILLISLIKLYKKHKSSSIEFVKNNRVVIVSKKLKICFLDPHIIKEFLILSKELIVLAGLKLKDL
jgi:hypothetical protein